MNDEKAVTPDISHAVSWRHFGRHYLEMVAAMAVGMALLGMLSRLVLTLLGHVDLLERMEPRTMLMATNMAIGMSVWMRYRGHTWAGVGEMVGAMYLPFVVLLPPFWAGKLSGEAVNIAGHLLMLPLMALVMLRRRDEYARNQRRSPVDGQHHPGSEIG
jgi:hypothetical protein